MYIQVYKNPWKLRQFANQEDSWADNQFKLLLSAPKNK